MLEKIKVELGIKTDDVGITDGINDLIASAKADLVLSGVSELKISDTDPLIIRAVKFYAKAHYGFDNTESEKNQERYNSLKAHLCLSSEYAGVI